MSNMALRGDGGGRVDTAWYGVDGTRGVADDARWGVP